jgi:hypothetical protein
LAYLRFFINFSNFKVLEMRNPWGNEYEWNGKWNDNDDSNWTPELRKKYDLVGKKPDGRFFMPFSEFVNYFDQYAICMYEDAYLLSSFTDDLESSFKGCYKFTINEAGDYFVSLSQPDSRGFPEMVNGESKQNFYLA